MIAMRTKGLALAVAALAAVSLSACGAGKKSGGGNTGAPTNGSTTSGSTPSGSSAPTGGGSITIGTTDQVVAVDPAGSYDFGSNMIENQIYQYLMVVPAGQKAPSPGCRGQVRFHQRRRPTPAR